MSVLQASLLHVVILGLVAMPLCAEPPKPERVVPPIDPELRTGPQMAERRASKDREATELRQKKSELEAQLAQAKEGGLDTGRIESAIGQIDAQLHALYRQPADDPIHRFWPELRARGAEIKQITRSDRPVSLPEARRLLDMLYLDIEPRLNRNLQHLTFAGIRNASNRNGLPDDAKRVLRDGLLEYFYATQDQCDSARKGAMCDPMTMSYFAEAISVVAAGDDAEAADAVDHLRDRAIAACKELDWDREGTMCEWILSEAQKRLAAADGDTIHPTVIQPEGMSQTDIAKLLRGYARLLKDKDGRTAPAAIAIIDQNLLALANAELTRRNWELWARVAILIGPKRASNGLRDYIAQQSGESQSSRTRLPLSLVRAFDQQRAQRTP